MRICAGDPWRVQFFRDVQCPENVFVPLKDYQAWKFYPNYRKVYDKLFVALSQGLKAAPHGVVPTEFPVFSKPITNLLSMGKGSMIIKDLETYRESLQPGHFWSTYLTGQHVSTDVAIVHGEIVWWRHSIAFPGSEGTFHYFRVEVTKFPKVEEWCSIWARTHLNGYTGMANFETIGSLIIEVHLRFTDQWPDLYGPRWMESVVRLYDKGIWDFDNSSDEMGFSVVLFGENGFTYFHPMDDVMHEARNVAGVLSIQISYHSDHRQTLQSNPPGGVRQAVINAKTLEAGETAREILRKGIKYKIRKNSSKS